MRIDWWPRKNSNEYNFVRLICSKTQNQNTQVEQLGASEVLIIIKKVLPCAEWEKKSRRSPEVKKKTRTRNQRQKLLPRKPFSVAEKYYIVSRAELNYSLKLNSIVSAFILQLGISHAWSKVKQWWVCGISAVLFILRIHTKIWSISQRPLCAIVTSANDFSYSCSIKREKLSVFFLPLASTKSKTILISYGIQNVRW